MNVGRKFTYSGVPMNGAELPVVRHNNEEENTTTPNSVHISNETSFPPGMMPMTPVQETRRYYHDVHYMPQHVPMSQDRLVPPGMMPMAPSLAMPSMNIHPKETEETNRGQIKELRERLWASEEKIKSLDKQLLDKKLALKDIEEANRCITEELLVKLLASEKKVKSLEIQLSEEKLTIKGAEETNRQLIEDLKTKLQTSEEKLHIMANLLSVKTLKETEANSKTFRVLREKICASKRRSKAQRKEISDKSKSIKNSEETNRKLTRKLRGLRRAHEDHVKSSEKCRSNERIKSLAVEKLVDLKVSIGLLQTTNLIRQEMDLLGAKRSLGLMLYESVRTKTECDQLTRFFLLAKKWSTCDNNDALAAGTTFEKCRFTEEFARRDEAKFLEMCIAQQSKIIKSYHLENFDCSETSAIQPPGGSLLLLPKIRAVEIGIENDTVRFLINYLAKLKIMEVDIFLAKRTIGLKILESNERECTRGVQELMKLNSSLKSNSEEAIAFDWALWSCRETLDRIKEEKAAFMESCNRHQNWLEDFVYGSIDDLFTPIVDSPSPLCPLVTLLQGLRLLMYKR